MGKTPVRIEVIETRTDKHGDDDDCRNGRSALFQATNEVTEHDDLFDDTRLEVIRRPTATKAIGKWGPTTSYLGI